MSIVPATDRAAFAALGLSRAEVTRRLSVSLMLRAPERSVSPFSHTRLDSSSVMEMGFLAIIIRYRIITVFVTTAPGRVHDRSTASRRPSWRRDIDGAWLV